MTGQQPPTLERKKRKREDRRRALRDAVAQPTRLYADCRVFAANSGEPLPSDVETWPIVRAYVPARNVWEATGLGTAGVVRQQPDGRHASAFFIVELLEHGLRGAFGGRDETLAKVEEDLRPPERQLPGLRGGARGAGCLVRVGSPRARGRRGLPLPAPDTNRLPVSCHGHRAPTATGSAIWWDPVG